MNELTEVRIEASTLINWTAYIGKTARKGRNIHACMKNKMQGTLWLAEYAPRNARQRWYTEITSQAQEDLLVRIKVKRKRLLVQPLQ